MLETISSLFDFADLSPHGLCLVWRPELIGLHVVSDAITGLAYYSIPLALVTFVRCRRDLAFSWMFGLFAIFILACGTTHFFSIWTLWQPDYGAQGVVKAATAIVSILTAIMLWPLLPKAVALPSPTQLAILNAALQREIAERREAETRLRASEARYAGFFNNLAEGLFISAVDADGRLILEAINGNLATAAGLDPVRSVGRLARRGPASSGRGRDRSSATDPACAPANRSNTRIPSSCPPGCTPGTPSWCPFAARTGGSFNCSAASATSPSASACRSNSSRPPSWPRWEPSAREWLTS